MKRVCIILMLMLPVQHLFACEICGCSSGNYFVGPTPRFNKAFIGLRHSFRSFETILKTDKEEFSKDFYQTTELWGGVKIKNKFSVLVFVPYNSYYSKSDDGEMMNKGFGDITLAASYNILDKLFLSKDEKTVSKQIWLGAGVKLPTGKYSVDAGEFVSSANNQAGTGSVDFVLTAAYNFIKDDHGLTGNLSYKANQSAKGFKFGNQFTATAFAFQSFSLKEITLSPNAGLLFENINPYEVYKNKLEDTGGHALLGALGLESRLDKITIGFNGQLPVLQNISDRQTTIKFRGMVHLTYAF